MEVQKVRRVHCSNGDVGSKILKTVGLQSAGMHYLVRLEIPSMGISNNRIDKHLSVVTRIGLTPLGSFKVTLHPCPLCFISSGNLWSLLFNILINTLEKEVSNDPVVT